jgi:hypothetical protein
MSKQPRDDGNAPIPVLGLRPNGGQVVTLSGGASHASNQFDHAVRVITIYSTVDCFVEIGNDTVQANASNSHFIPAQFLCDLSLGFDNNASRNSKYLAAYSVESGSLYISERI